MLKVSRYTSVLGAIREAVGGEHHFFSAEREHRLNRNNHPRFKECALSPLSVVRYERAFVHRVPDPVPRQVAHHTEIPLRFYKRFYRVPDVARSCPSAHGAYAYRKRFLGNGDELLFLRINLAYRYRERRVGEKSTMAEPKVNTYNVAFAQDLISTRKSVHNFVVHRYAKRRGKLALVFFSLIVKKGWGVSTF